MTKLHFLKTETPRLLASIPPDTAPAWGKMNLQQMIEHMSDSVRVANGRDLQDCVTPAEHIPKMQAFVMSDVPFKENTVNKLLPADPLDARFDNVDDAIGELKLEIAEFIEVFDQDKQKTITNPFFGDLNFEQWTALLYKHMLHHLRQFGVVPEPAEAVSDAERGA